MENSPRTAIALTAWVLLLAPAAALGQTPPGSTPTPTPTATATATASPTATATASPAPPTPPAVDESVNVGAPSVPGPPTGERALLAGAIDDLLRMTERDPALRRALRQVRRAQRTLGASLRGMRPTHLAKAVGQLKAARRALGSAPAVARQLDAVARSIARGVLARLSRSGAKASVIARVRRHVARGAFGKGVKQGVGAMVFDPARFEANIRGFFDNQTTGYSYAITRKQQIFSEKGFGFAQTPADIADGIAQGPFREMNIASVTKTITAAAVLKLMEKNKLDLDESIRVWLPDEWDVHPSIEQLTWGELMTQTSGMDGNLSAFTTSFEKLQSNMKQGIKPADKTYAYQNANFGIFRVIIPALLGVNLYGDPDTPPDVLAAETYVNYLKTQVFDQDETLPDCKPDEAKFGFATRAYTFPYNGKKGFDMGDWSLGCGGGGLHLSAHELARFQVRLRYTNEILGPLARKRMNDGFLGYMDPASTPSYSWNSGAFGTYRSHGGDLNYTTGEGIDTCAINFPIAVQAVVLINSRNGSYPYQCAALAQAFDAAWVAS